MMKKFIETANQSAEMCVIGLYGACEIVKTYPGVTIVMFATIAAIARIAYIEGVARGLGL
ncbi:hypothetical protein [Phascolarctobacterium faecium]|uniref:hypothetical protein n=1 Tax=Phascolarctobacterium faecium TaxID=33025 RepID=UPI003AB7A703